MTRTQFIALRDCFHWKAFILYEINTIKPQDACCNTKYTTPSQCNSLHRYKIVNMFSDLLNSILCPSKQENYCSANVLKIHNIVLTVQWKLKKQTTHTHTHSNHIANGKSRRDISKNYMIHRSIVLLNDNDIYSCFFVFFLLLLTRLQFTLVTDYL